MLNFQLFGGFPVIFSSLISNLIPWQSENTLCMASLIWNLLTCFEPSSVVLFGLVWLCCVLLTMCVSGFTLLCRQIGCLIPHCVFLPTYLFNLLMDGHVGWVQPLLSYGSSVSSLAHVPHLTRVQGPATELWEESMCPSPHTLTSPESTGWVESRFPFLHILTHKDLLVLVSGRGNKFNGWFISKVMVSEFQCADVLFSEIAYSFLY